MEFQILEHVQANLKHDARRTAQNLCSMGINHGRYQSETCYTWVSSWVISGLCNQMNRNRTAHWWFLDVLLYFCWWQLRFHFYKCGKPNKPSPSHHQFWGIYKPSPNGMFMAARVSHIPTFSSELWWLVRWFLQVRVATLPTLSKILSASRTWQAREGAMGHFGTLKQLLWNVTWLCPKIAECQSLNTQLPNIHWTLAHLAHKLFQLLDAAG